MDPTSRRQRRSPNGWRRVGGQPDRRGDRAANLHPAEDRFNELLAMQDRGAGHIPGHQRASGNNTSELVGSAARFVAMAAPRLPASAKTFRRAGLDETMASSDIARTPFTRVSATTMRISSRTRGCSVSSGPRSSEGLQEGDDRRSRESPGQHRKLNEKKSFAVDGASDRIPGFGLCASSCRAGNRPAPTAPDARC
jgi:hypothetical protein